MQAQAVRTGVTSIILVAVAGVAAAAVFLATRPAYQDVPVVEPMPIEIQAAAQPVVAAEAAPSAVSLPQPSLPKGAIARLGKGSLRGFAAASGTLAVATSTGLEVYSDGQDPLWAASTQAPVASVALSADGAYLAALSDGTLEVRRTATGEALFSLDFGDLEVQRPAFQPGGDLLAVGVEGEVRLYSLPDGDLRETLSAGAKVLDLTWAPDGSSLLLGATDLLRWVPGGEPVTLVRTKANQTVEHVAWAGDGGLIAASLSDGTLLLADPEAASLRFESAPHLVNDLALSADGRSLATGGHDGKVALFETASFSRTASLKAGGAEVIQVAFQPDGRLVSAAKDGGLVTWDVQSGEPIGRLRGYGQALNSIAWSPDGRWIAAGGIFGTVTLWDANTGEPATRLQGHRQAVSRLVWSPDGSRLATIAAEPTVLVWDPASGAVLHRLAFSQPTADAAFALMPDGTPMGSIQEGNAVTAAFSPDGSLLAVGDENARIVLWDLDSGEPFQVLEGHTQYVYDLAFAEAGSTLISMSVDGALIRWQVETGEAIERSHHPGMASFTLAPDGSRAAFGPWEGELTLVDPQTLEPQGRLAGGNDALVRAIFSPDGRYIAAGYEADLNGAGVWDAATGETVAHLSGHTLDVRQVAFSPDGSLLATASWDGSILLWQLPR